MWPIWRSETLLPSCMSRCWRGSDTFCLVIACLTACVRTFPTREFSAAPGRKFQESVMAIGNQSPIIAYIGVLVGCKSREMKWPMKFLKEEMSAWMKESMNEFDCMHLFETGGISEWMKGGMRTNESTKKNSGFPWQAIQEPLPPPPSGEWRRQHAAPHAAG